MKHLVILISIFALSGCMKIGENMIVPAWKHIEQQQNLDGTTTTKVTTQKALISQHAASVAKTATTDDRLVNLASMLNEQCSLLEGESSKTACYMMKQSAGSQLLMARALQALDPDPGTPSQAYYQYLQTVEVQKTNRRSAYAKALLGGFVTNQAIGAVRAFANNSGTKVSFGDNNTIGGAPGGGQEGVPSIEPSEGIPCDLESDLECGEDGFIPGTATDGTDDTDSMGGSAGDTIFIIGDGNGTNTGVGDPQLHIAQDQAIGSSNAENVRTDTGTNQLFDSVGF